jgi:uncharacterized protein YndB with AHSA1/START domain
MQTPMRGSEPNARIQKSVLLHAPRSRVWRAVADPTELGWWFGLKFESGFSEGSRVCATIVPTGVDLEVAREQRKFEGTKVEMEIERIEPERYLSFRWHPFPVDQDVDYSAEPTTLVTFEIEPRSQGAQLTVTELGFERLPRGRREKAFEANERGWGKQLELIERYLTEQS